MTKKPAGFSPRVRVVHAELDDETVERILDPIVERDPRKPPRPPQPTDYGN